jgi:carbon starvation protein
MFSELFLKEGEATYKDAKGARKVLAHPLFGTVSMVLIGCILGGLSLSQIWGLFGAANQLLAGIALMAVAAWLGEVGKNNKMFYFPMIFMILVTLTSLVFTIKSQITAIIAGGTGVAWCYIRAILAILLVILAIDLVVEGSKALAAQAKAKKAA